MCDITVIPAFTEPFQQTVVWPTYSQTQTTLPTAPHLLMPPLTAHQLQPPPLAPLLLGSSDYLAASTTMHQHTQSTRLVALSSESKRCKGSPTVPMPIQSTPTIIKIEDCSPVSHIGSGPPSLTEHSLDPKGLPTAAISGTIQTNDLSSDLTPQLSYYHAHGLHGNLIQIAPHSTSMNTIGHNTHSVSTAAIIGTLPQPCAQIYSHPSNVVATSVSCLTPPSDPFTRSDLDSSGVSSIPEGMLLFIFPCRYSLY